LVGSHAAIEAVAAAMAKHAVTARTCLEIFMQLPFGTGIKTAPDCIVFFTARTMRTFNSATHQITESLLAYLVRAPPGNEPPG
jgi:hypothetical protein